MNRPIFLVAFSLSVLISTGTRAYGLAESTGQGGSNAQAVHESGQKGAGVNIGLISAWNVYSEHEAFLLEDANGQPTDANRVTNLVFYGDSVHKFNHDTWMAGIAASRGGQYDPNDINNVGVAPQANIVSARIANDSLQTAPIYIENALQELIVNRDCRIIMTGIAFDADDLPTGWEEDLSPMYDYYAYFYDVVFSPGAGNASEQVNIFGDMYNGITTAGVITLDETNYTEIGDISNSGPTTDGRRKPDVAAPTNKQTVPNSGSYTWSTPPWNDGRTSLSGPHTAGIAALLLGYADQTPDTDDGENEVIKAVIVNSAFPNINDKDGASTNPLDPNNVWHADRGYGRVDALRAYEQLSAGQIVKDTNVSQDKGWAYETMTSTTQADHYFIQCRKNERLILTVTWDRRFNKAGSLNYNEETDPKFRVNLAIKDSNGIELYSESDDLNNLKKVEILLPRSDTYEIVLTNPGTKSNRSYAMAFELIQPLVADFNIDYVVDYHDLGILTSDWLLSGSVADLTGGADVNLRDFAAFANHYTNSNPLYH